VKLSDIQKRALFKALATKTQYEAGVEFGLDKHYKSNTSVINAVRRIYQDVSESPETYAVSPDVVELVQRAMEERKSRPRAIQGAKMRSGELDTLDTKNLVLSSGKKAWILLDEKLNYLMKHPKAFKGESLMSIAKVAGISFDKGQIAKGEATEHILLKAQIREDMSAKEALEEIMKMREASMQK